jgi:hypothetical protein
MVDQAIASQSLVGALSITFEFKADICAGHHEMQISAMPKCSQQLNHIGASSGANA